jgi:hypothetical protein
LVARLTISTSTLTSVALGLTIEAGSSRRAPDDDEGCA